MKKIAAILVLLLLMFGWSVLGKAGTSMEDVSDSDIALLRRAFSAISAEAGGAEISGWAVIATHFYSPREAEAAVEEMAKTFELNPAEYTIHLRSTGHYGYAVMEYTLSDNVSLRLQVQSLDEETRASVELVQNNFRNLDYNYQQVRDALERVGGEDVKITSCLEGYMNARLGNGEKLNTVYAVFHALDAIYQEGVESHGVAVWSGWSSLFSQSVNTGRKDVNFGISLRWDNESGRTIVHIATPVLPGSY